MVVGMLEALSDGVCVIERGSHRIIYTNSAMKEMLKWKSNGVGSTVIEGVMRANLLCTIHEIDEETCGEKTISSPDGTKTLLVRGYDCEYQGKQCHVKVVKDITKAGEVRDVNEDNSKVIREAIKQTGLVFWEYDLQTHRAYFEEQIYGYVAQIANKKMIPEELRSIRFISESAIEEVEKMYQSLLHGEDDVTCVGTVRFPDGEKKCRFHMTVIPGPHGERRKAVGTMESIQDQTAIENCFLAVARQQKFHFFSYDIKDDILCIYYDDPRKERRIFPNYRKNISHRYSSFHPEDLPRFLEGLKEIETTKEEYTGTFRWRKNPTENYGKIKASMSPAFNSNGDVFMVHGTIIDISETERRKTNYESQKAFMESYRKSSLAYARVNLTEDMIYDAYSKYQRFTRGMNARSLEHWVNNLCRYVSREDVKEEIEKKISVDHLIQRLDNGYGEEKIVVPLIVAENKERFAELRITLMENPVTLEKEGYITLKDITKIKRQQETGRTLVKMDFEIVASVNYCTALVEEVMLSSQTQEDTRVFPTGKYYDYLERFLYYVVPEDKNRVRDAMQLNHVVEHLKDKKSYSVTLAMVRQGKKYYKRVVFMELLEFQQELVVMCQDISEMHREEHKKQEQLKKALSEAKKAENAKIDFLSRMSHDLRTPLNGILGMASIATDETNEENIREYLEKISSSGQLLLSLVNDILDISQLEENKMVLRKEAYSMQEFLQSTNQIIEEQCRAKGMSYKVNFGELENAFIVTDKLRFGQIFMNLLSNAVKYTPEGGNIEFKGEILKEWSHQAEIKLSVKDNGIGMSEEFLERAFDAFSQEGIASCGQSTGSGLGLSIVKQLVELFEGSIDVSSTVGKGTTIEVVLNVELAEPILQRKEVNEAHMSVMEGRHILIAEDQPLNAKILTKLLNKQGIIVDLAEDGRKAVSSFMCSKEGKYDAILMDVRMPNMDGMEATREIRSHKERGDWNIPIIATTANAFLEDKMKCKEAGMDEHVSKPINAKELYACLERCWKVD
ncbi:MAG: response regulator [Lachnospiraceae bacterium]|nr:response regulator [Lachnospiraceae bacterium]